MLSLPAHASPLERLWHYLYILICVSVFGFLIAPLIVIIPLSFNAEPYFTFSEGMLSFDPNAYSLRCKKPGTETVPVNELEYDIRFNP